MRSLEVPAAFDVEKENTDVLQPGREFHPPKGRQPAFWSRRYDVVWPSSPEDPLE
jgi:hypothetical protein